MRTIKILPIWWGILMVLATNQIKADSIVRVGACATPGVAWNVFVRDSIAYIADRDMVTTVNIINPYNPSVIDFINGGPPIAALGIYPFDTVAYCNLTGIGTRFITINISKPDSLSLLGWCSLSAGGMGNPTGIVLKDTIIYLATGNAGVMQINVSDPSQPDTIKSYSSIAALDLFLQDTLLFIVGGFSFKVLNVADPLNPFLLGSVPLPSTNRGVFVVDTFAYVTRYSEYSTDPFGYLVVINVSDPTDPQIVATSDNLKGKPCDVWVQSHYAYVAAEDFWYPENLSKKETRSTGFNHSFGGRADEEGGLRIVNISDPLNPTLIASYDTPQDPRGVFAVDTLIFIADQESLQILRHVGSGVEEEKKQHLIDFDINVHPNPFFESITIRYNLPKPENATLDIFDVTGRCVRTIFHGQKGAGAHSMQWNATDQEGIKVSSGIYILRLRIGSEVLSSTIILAK